MNSSNQNPQADITDEDAKAAGATGKNKQSRFSKLFGRQQKTATDTTVVEPASGDAEQHPAATPQALPDTPAEGAPAASAPAKPEVSIEDGLAPTRAGLLSKIGKVFRSTFDLNNELFEELEETLMACDIGVSTSLDLVDRLRERVKAERIPDANGVLQGLRQEISELLNSAQQAWPITQSPHVILVVGVNGVGKTTTTAKIANHFQRHGKRVMIAAADTFRAAAVEQLQEWGKRLDIPVIAQGHGADAAAVAHDALTSAIARNVDILLVDTAGRLHTQTDLMEQLQKVKRVLQKIDAGAPHEVMQVLDAGTGQNALAQLEHFRDAVGVSSLCLTKLDGSAKGGVVLALTDKYRLPIRFLGVGESIDDLREFDAGEFAGALIPAANAV